MRYSGSSISIKKRRDELARWIKTVIEHADGERESLGFLPVQAYEEAAVQEKMLVAVAGVGQGEQYAGHLLFGGSFPHLKVFQIYTAPDFRGAGIATLMLDSLVKLGEGLGYLSIAARVAEDLVPANRFWQVNGFEIARRTRGGTTTGRVIAVRVRELKTPTLFTVLENPGRKDLRLEARLSETHRTYALDLNVIFDLTKHRANADSVRRIFNAALNGIFEVRVTEEFINELQRSSSGNPDPLLQFASTLPCFPPIPRTFLERIRDELASEIFPERAAAGRLTVQDYSDLAHLCSAIHHKAVGFITSEKAILGRREYLNGKYGLEIMGPTELAESTSSAQWSGEADLRLASQSEISICQMGEPDRRQTERFLESLSVPDETIKDALSAGASGALRRRLLVRTPSQIIGLASWDPPNSLRGEVSLHIYVDEDHLGAETILDYLLDHASTDASSAGPVALKIKLRRGQELARSAAVAHGFREAGSPSIGDRLLIKICVGRFVTEKNWSRVRSKVKRISSVVLPERIPAYDGEDTAIKVRTPRKDTITLSLGEIEALLGPTLLILPRREGVLVPIRRHFVEELFATPPQTSLFPRQEAALLSQRVYYSHPRTASVLKTGMPMFFYESKRDRGRGVAFAGAKIRRVELRSVTQVTRELERRGVLSKKILRAMSGTGQVAVTHFQSIIAIKKPVEYKTLRDLGCVDGSNLVTARKLDEDQMRNLLEAGQANE